MFKNSLNKTKGLIHECEECGVIRSSFEVLIAYGSDGEPIHIACDYMNGTECGETGEVSACDGCLNYWQTEKLTTDEHRTESAYCPDCI